MLVDWRRVRFKFAVEPGPKLRAFRHPLRQNGTEANFAFVDGDVRLGAEADQVIGGRAGKRTRRAEVERQADLVHRGSVKIKRPNAAADHGADFNAATE